MPKGATRVATYRLRYLRESDHDAFAREVTAALRASVNVEFAAAKLGLVYRTLARWLREEPDLRAGIPLRGPGHWVGERAVAGR